MSTETSAPPPAPGSADSTPISGGANAHGHHVSEPMDVELSRERASSHPHDVQPPTAPANANGKSGAREKQIKANKIYIGGLPESARQEDLQACFGKIGRIVNIELKLGYGFVEFDNRGAAEESVAEYHEGYFMGNKIRVELSHGGGRTAKYAGEPGACFKCGQQGHWARECPSGDGDRRSEPPSRDRRGDYPPRADPPRSDYGAPPPRARSPPRDYAARGRDSYDERRDYRAPPPAAPPRPYYPEYDPRGSYAAAPPVPRDPYDRPPYDRRGPPPMPPAPAPAPYPAGGGRPRSPPRSRDTYDRSRDYPPPRADYGRRSPGYGAPPPRTGDYPPPGYRRRSVSPPRGPPPNDQYRAPYPGGAPTPYPPAPEAAYDYRSYPPAPPMGGAPRGAPSLGGGGRDRVRDDRRSSGRM
ncbi:hypothetical protein DL93DRAFT_2094811 [Clavulina sp. PMI_390]|nr:hypothetical protein DL93DRAFT_2094811 [Clavulina sp. PMI_390]